MSSHKQRAAKVREFTDKNKVFSVIAVMIIAFLVVSSVRNKIEETKNAERSAIVAVEEDEVDTNINERPHWKFYLSDFIILGAGGGFCCYKILQERKKAKERL